MTTREQRIVRPICKSLYSARNFTFNLLYHGGEVAVGLYQ